MVIAEMTKDGYRAVREQFLELPKHIRERDRMGNYWKNGQGAIEVGQLRFYVGADVNEEKLRRQMERAQALVSDMPRFVTKSTSSSIAVPLW